MISELALINSESMPYIRVQDNGKNLQSKIIVPTFISLSEYIYIYIDMFVEVGLKSITESVLSAAKTWEKFPGVRREVNFDMKIAKSIGNTFEPKNFLNHFSALL